MKQFKRALISVSNKNNLGPFIDFLKDQGTQIVSTGGTARFIKDMGVPVIDVSEQTGFEEVMDGRVKTLHPKIHMALLARENNSSDNKVLENYELEKFDLVVGNLYPFEEVLQPENNSQNDLIEKIDIGGPSFLRAAAKNFERITVICDPEDYRWVMEKEEMTLDDRKMLCAKVFSHTSVYDSLISKVFQEDFLSKEFSVGGKKVSDLRYGENPQQIASWYTQSGLQGGLHQANILHGKPLSYNNLLDLDAALMTMRDFKNSAVCVAVKHLNPCGIGIGKSISDAVEKGLKADPVSVFGGIIALNKEVCVDSANQLKKLFLECVVAPSFSKKALEILTTKKNIRLLELKNFNNEASQYQVKSIYGGFLVQSHDEPQLWNSDWKIIGETPTEEIKRAIELSWLACAHLKSNAIAITSSEMTLGLGVGQVNRVDAVEQAIERYEKFHAKEVPVVLSSDAFFPFADSIERIHKAGIKWIVQPGGSIKDEEVFETAKKSNINLVITGKRHFNH